MNIELFAQAVTAFYLFSVVARTFWKLACMTYAKTFNDDPDERTVTGDDAVRILLKSFWVCATWPIPKAIFQMKAERKAKPGFIAEQFSKLEKAMVSAGKKY